MSDDSIILPKDLRLVLPHNNKNRITITGADKPGHIIQSWVEYDSFADEWIVQLNGQVLGVDNVRDGLASVINHMKRVCSCS